MVPKSQFVDVTEKISKQTTAEAFRQRFGTRKAKPRPELEVEEEEDDLDSFFEELDRARDGGENHILSFFFLFFVFLRDLKGGLLVGVGDGGC